MGWTRSNVTSSVKIHLFFKKFSLLCFTIGKYFRIYWKIGNIDKYFASMKTYIWLLFSGETDTLGQDKEDIRMTQWPPFTDLSLCTDAFKYLLIQLNTDRIHYNSGISPIWLSIIIMWQVANKGPSSQGCGFSCGHVWMWELDWRNLSTKELMFLNCGVGEDSWESLGLQGDPTSPF